MALEDELQALDAEVVLPADPTYDEARQAWNLAVDKRPLAIVRPADAETVAATIKLVVGAGVPLAVRSGGHSYAGHSSVDAGVVLDLQRIAAIEVDQANRHVNIGPGARWSDVTDALAGHGLAAVGGHVSGVGVAGLLLGGGIGWLARKVGLACDNLISAEVVTAAGEIVSASAEENPDLFWGLRGGGGNFGVVTRFTVQAHPIATVYGGMLVFTAERARDLLGLIRDLGAAADDDLNIMCALTAAPPAPFIPAEHHFKPAVLVGACFTGPAELGEAAFAPLRAFGCAIADLLGPMPYAALAHLFDGFNAPDAFHMRSHLLGTLDDAGLDALISQTADMPPGHGAALLIPLGGAAGRCDGVRASGRDVQPGDRWQLETGRPGSRGLRRVGRTLFRSHEAVGDRSRGQPHG